MKPLIKKTRKENPISQFQSIVFDQSAYLPDNLFKIIRNDGRPERAHGGRAFNGHDQLFVRHTDGCVGESRGSGRFR